MSKTSGSYLWQVKNWTQGFTDRAKDVSGEMFQWNDLSVTEKIDQRTLQPFLTGKEIQLGPPDSKPAGIKTADLGRLSPRS